MHGRNSAQPRERHDAINIAQRRDDIPRFRKHIVQRRHDRQPSVRVGRPDLGARLAH
jgi:hypothetical protein